MGTKNITLAIDEDLLEQARRIALDEKTSVNAMVRDLLLRKVAQSTTTQRRREAARRLVELGRGSNLPLPGGWTFEREEIYGERFSRYERDNPRGNDTE